MDQYKRGYKEGLEDAILLRAEQIKANTSPLRKHAKLLLDWLLRQNSESTVPQRPR